MIDLTNYFLRLKSNISDTELVAFSRMVKTAEKRLGIDTTAIKSMGYKDISKIAFGLCINKNNEFELSFRPWLNGRMEVNSLYMLKVIEQCVEEREGNVNVCRDTAVDVSKLSADHLIQLIKSAREELARRTQDVL